MLLYENVAKVDLLNRAAAWQGLPRVTLTIALLHMLFVLQGIAFALHCTAFYCICIALHLHCAVLHCIALCCKLPACRAFEFSACLWCIPTSLTLVGSWAKNLSLSRFTTVFAIDWMCGVCNWSTLTGILFPVGGSAIWLYVQLYICYMYRYICYM